MGIRTTLATVSMWPAGPSTSTTAEGRNKGNDDGEVGGFVDCLVAVRLRDGVIRLEFGEFEEPRRGTVEAGVQEAKDAVPKHRLLMPLQGFVGSLNLMQEALRRLEGEQKRRLRKGQPQGESDKPVVVAASRRRDTPFVAESPAGPKLVDGE